MMNMKEAAKTIALVFVFSALFSGCSKPKDISGIYYLEQPYQIVDPRYEGTVVSYELNLAQAGTYTLTYTYPIVERLQEIATGKTTEKLGKYSDTCSGKYRVENNTLYLEGKKIKMDPVTIKGGRLYLGKTPFVTKK
jgi:hypothetical protein